MKDAGGPGYLKYRANPSVLQSFVAIVGGMSDQQLRGTAKLLAINRGLQVS